jgi:hypothetical protein
LARIAGVTDNKIKKVWESFQKWREKILLAVDQGDLPYNWRELIKVGLISSRNYRPKLEAQAFANIFSNYVPQAPTGRIVEWVNVTLKSLGQPPVSKSSLNDYIKKRQQISPATPISITE